MPSGILLKIVTVLESGSAEQVEIHLRWSERDKPTAGQTNGWKILSLLQNLK